MLIAFYWLSFILICGVIASKRITFPARPELLKTTLKWQLPFLPRKHIYSLLSSGNNRLINKCPLFVDRLLHRMPFPLWQLPQRNDCLKMDAFQVVFTAGLSQSFLNYKGLLRMIFCPTNIFFFKYMMPANAARLEGYIHNDC